MLEATEVDELARPNGGRHPTRTRRPALRAGRRYITSLRQGVENARGHPH